MARFSSSAALGGGQLPAPAFIRAPTPLGNLTDTAGNRFVDQDGNNLIGLSAFDDGSVRTADLWKSKGLLFGTSIQADYLMNAAGPTGFATRRDWVASEADVFVPGFIMMGDVFNPSSGTFNMAPILAFLADARARGKKVRAHVPGYYGKRDTGTWIDTALQQNPTKWPDMMTSRIDAIGPILADNADLLLHVDVVNEACNTGNTNIYQLRATPWTTAAAVSAGRTAATATLADYLAPIVFAFQRMRKWLPKTLFFYCQDQTELLGTDFYNTFATNVASAVEAMIAAGATFDGFAQQGHLAQRLPFNGTRLRTFLQRIMAAGLKIVISELDVQTGFAAGKGDTPDPATYTRAELDRINAAARKQYLDVALPFVIKSGGDALIEWTLDNGYSSWIPPAGERPCAYDASFLPTPQLAVTRQAVLEI